MKKILMLVSVFYLFSTFAQTHGGGSVYMEDEVNTAIAKERVRHKLKSRTLSNATIETSVVKTPVGTSYYRDGDLLGCGQINIGNNTLKTIKQQTVIIDGSVTNFETGRRCRDKTR